VARSGADPQETKPGPLDPLDAAAAAQLVKVLVHLPPLEAPSEDGHSRSNTEQAQPVPGVGREFRGRGTRRSPSRGSSLPSPNSSTTGSCGGTLSATPSPTSSSIRAEPRERDQVDSTGLIRLLADCAPKIPNRQAMPNAQKPGPAPTPSAVVAPPGFILM